MKVQFNFFTQHISTYLGPPCVYILSEKQHPSYVCASALWSTVGRKLILFLFTDCGPPY